MVEQIKNYEVEICNDLIIIRHNGETIKAAEVKPNDALEKFKSIVKSLREKLLG